MTMTTPRDFKTGDRVVGNDRNIQLKGRRGTVKYVSGGMCWVKFDDSDAVAGGLYPWSLDPLPAGRGR